MIKITAELKTLHSPDIVDLESYLPRDGEGFGFLLQAMFGPKDKDGEESFDIIVCNTAWIEGKLTNKDVMSGRHLLIVKEYSLHAINYFLRNYAERCVGDSWQEVAEKLSRLGRWEFEDYTP
jgi:hypothetical protein